MGSVRPRTSSGTVSSAMSCWVSTRRVTSRWCRNRNRYSVVTTLDVGGDGGGGTGRERFVIGQRLLEQVVGEHRPAVDAVSAGRWRVMEIDREGPVVAFIRQSGGLAAIRCRSSMLSCPV